MTKFKELSDDEEMDASFLKSEEYSRQCREVLKKTYGMLKGWKRTGQEVKDRARRELY